MEQDKTKILSDLYAIRATMSVVAKNDDEAEEEQNEIGKTQIDIEREKSSFALEKNSTEAKLNDISCATYIKRLEEKLPNAQKELKREQEYFERDRKETERRYKDSRHSFKHYFTFVPGKVWGIYCGVDAGIWALILFIFWFCWAPSDPGLYWGLWCGLPTSIVLFIIHPIVYLYYRREKVYEYESYKRKHYDPSKDKLEKCQKEVDELEDGIKRAKTAILNGEVYMTPDDARRVEGELAEQEQIYQAIIKRLEDQILPHKNAIKEIAICSQGIIESATKAYPLIDFRDWENVDLIIYYFETGRADDMKEALQLVDRQRQTDQIAQAIAMASREISRTFDDSMRRLGSALAQSFSVLSRQMAQQHAELMAGMEQQAEAQGEMFEAQNRELRGLREQAAAEISMQVSAQAMNQALLEKISVSSLDLAEKMARQMREVHGLY